MKATNRELQAGDRVRLIKNSGPYKVGDEAVIFDSTISQHYDWGAQFDKALGHHCNGECKNGHGRYIDEDEVELVSRGQRIVTHFQIY